MKKKSTSELIEKCVPKSLWSRKNLTDYIYFLEHELGEYEEIEYQEF